MALKLVRNDPEITLDSIARNPSLVEGLAGGALRSRWFTVSSTPIAPAPRRADRPRTLGLAGDLFTVMQEARARRRLDCPFVFHMNGKPLNHCQPWRIWHKACREAGHPGKLIHDLRRTAIRNMTRSGVPQSVAMAISGHKTNAIFQRYNITSEADLTDAQVRLSDYLARQRANGVKP